MVANEVLEHYALRVTFNYVLPLLTVSISWKKKPTFLPICTAAILYFYFFFPSKKCYRKRLYGLQVHEMDYGNMTPSIQIQLKEEMIKKKKSGHHKLEMGSGFSSTRVTPFSPNKSS